MKKLNERAEAIFRRLVDGLEEPGAARKINKYPRSYMAVCVEQIAAVGGQGIFSIAHYGQQNGDAMRDPDMTFLWVKGEMANVADEMVPGVYPLSFRNDYVGADREAVRFDWEGCGIRIEVDEREQADEVRFANEWMETIRDQQEV